LLLLLYALARGRSLVPALWPQQGPRLLVAGLLNVAAFNLCTTFAQLSTSTARASVLTYTMPMISALMAWLLLGERPDRRRAAALLLGSAGIALLAWPVVQRMQAGDLDRRVLMGLAMPLLAATAWAAGTVFTKRWPIAGDRFVNTGWQLLIGAASGAIGAAIAGGDGRPRCHGPWPPPWRTTSSPPPSPTWSGSCCSTASAPSRRSPR
jgi:drug/metabolite transporter (DMT)-like permease